jgi:hypothetical protein
MTEFTARVVVPYLVQRGRIKSPLGGENSARLKDSIEWDYMGSAEFEFGALPASLRRMQANRQDYMLQKLAIPQLETDGSETNGYTLRVYSRFKSQDLEKYYEHLQALRNNRLDTKESTGFGLKDSTFVKERTNFWWDLDNDAMFSFHKVAMNRLHSWLENSWSYMGKI